mmetsp:Transcript_27261/g.75206  ORF Transcript_27261/g.75206 Transcript_27261/m.75206 type:complete len:283 (-) Transcript_27261:304-1152(-)
MSRINEVKQDNSTVLLADGKGKRDQSRSGNLSYTDLSGLIGQMMKSIMDHRDQFLQQDPETNVLLPIPAFPGIENVVAAHRAKRSPKERSPKKESKAVVGNRRPSDLRRQQLCHHWSNIPAVSDSFPIERYYEVIDKVYDSFQSAFTSNNLDEAYVYGKQYCAFCSEAIPKHRSYSAANSNPLAWKHHTQVRQVLQLLEIVVQKMDVEEDRLKQQNEYVDAAPQPLHLDTTLQVLHFPRQEREAETKSPESQMSAGNGQQVPDHNVETTEVKKTPSPQPTGQ